MAKLGNEGQSTGSHLHEQADIDGQPVNLAGQADAWIHGIEMKADFGNVHSFRYDAMIHALVNTEQHIILQRQNVLGTDGKNHGEFIAYAWTSGFSKDNANTWEKMTYKRATYLDDNGVVQDKEIWLSVLDESLRWDSINRKFIPRFS
jgi:murein DD-endopeptidase MepM/ murein hydrolase activator NlpD